MFRPKFNPWRYTYRGTRRFIGFWAVRYAVLAILLVFAWFIVGVLLDSDGSLWELLLVEAMCSIPFLFVSHFWAMDDFHW